ncbi:MAG TPA: hypothetical protein VGK02_00050 [Candidatus Aquicultor sp.]|jgi:hypothetical protein
MKMSEQMINFIKDLITLYQEKYNETLFEEKGESEQDKVFRLGSNIAYYDCLDILESQLKAFGYDTEIFGVITPELGKPDQ